METNSVGTPPARPWAIPLVLALLPFLLFLPLTLGQRTFFVHDLQYYFYPYHIVSANIVRGGSLPLWNPYAFSGIPLIGDGQTAMFYPPNWLFFLFPGALALSYAVLLQFSIAGVGMYLCARHFGLSALPALIAALSYMFSGFLTARIVHLSIMSGAALVPLLVWLADRALTLRTPRAFVAAAAGAALHAFSGHPQIPVYTALGLGLLALVRAAESGRWRFFLMLPLRLVGIYLFGYAMAAIQLAPWIELGLASPRAAGATFEFVMGTGAHGPDWLLFLFPFLYGQIEPHLFGNVPMGISAAVRAWEHSAYVGILPLALAPLGVALLLARTLRRQFDTRWYTLLWLLLLALAGVIIGAGKYSPLAGLVYATPVLGKLRDVERALVLVSFALALFAAFGLQWLIEWRSMGARLVAGLSAALIVVAPAFWVWFAGRHGGGKILGVEPTNLHHLLESRPSAYVPLALALASGALLVFWALRRPGPRTLALAALLLLADMGVYAASYQPLMNAAQFERQPAVLSALQSGGQPFRKATFLSGSNDMTPGAAQETLAVSWAMAFGVEDINGFNSLQPRRYTDYLYGPQVGDVSYGYLGKPALLQANSPILSSLNVRYLLVPVDMTQPPIGPQFRQVYRSREVRVFENTLVWPRAFFTGSARSENDPAVVLSAVTAPGFDARQASLVEGALPTDLAAGPGVSSASVSNQAPNRLEIAASTDAPRLLVVSEMFFGGWRATIDGAEVPILRTNYLFRGVVVPTGAHTVVFEYRPLSVELGLAATLAALAIALVVWWRGGRARDAK